MQTGRKLPSGGGWTWTPGWRRKPPWANFPYVKEQSTRWRTPGHPARRCIWWYIQQWASNSQCWSS